MGYVDLYYRNLSISLSVLEKNRQYESGGGAQTPEKIYKYESAERKREKVILDILRKEGPKSVGDLASNELIKGQASQRAKEVPDTWRKDIYNSLRYLEFLGVVDEKGGLWWYIEYEAAYRRKDYVPLMKHASIILPGLIEISNQYGGSLHSEKVLIAEIPLGYKKGGNHDLRSHFDKEFAIKYAKQHLKTGHHKIVYVDAALNVKEALGKLEKNIEEELKNEFRKAEILVSDTIIRHMTELVIHDLTHREKKLRQDFEYVGKGVIWAGFFIAEKREGKEEGKEKEIRNITLTIFKKYESGGDYNGIKNMLENTETGTTSSTVPINEHEFEDLFNKIRQEADRELFPIIFTILGGSPFQGKCDRCPRIYWR